MGALDDLLKSNSAARARAAKQRKADDQLAGDIADPAAAKRRTAERQAEIDRLRDLGVKFAEELEDDDDDDDEADDEADE